MVFHCILQCLTMNIQVIQVNSYLHIHFTLTMNKNSFRFLTAIQYSTAQGPSFVGHDFQLEPIKAQGGRASQPSEEAPNCKMHAGDMTEIEQASLTEQEKEALLQVMERAKVKASLHSELCRYFVQLP